MISGLRLIVLVATLLISATEAGFWSDTAGDSTEADVEVSTNGETMTTTTTKSNSCKKTPFPELPGKFLAPLGTGSGTSSYLVFIADKGSPWWCGDAKSLPAKAAQRQSDLRIKYTKTFVANSKAGGVRSAFGITKRTQLPAVAVVEPTTGKRYVLRNGEGDLESLVDSKVDMDAILEILKRPKPLDSFDLSWVTEKSQAYSTMMQDGVTVALVMVKNSKQAKILVKDGLRKIAQKNRGIVRIVLSKDPGMWRRYGISAGALPTVVMHDVAEDRTQNHGTLNKASRMQQIIDQLLNKKTYKRSKDVYDSTYEGKFHRVSWSPHLYVMDDFLTEKECQQMIKNAYPTLSTGSLVGDNINKKIKDLRFTVVPDNKITKVEQTVIDRIHDNVRLSEEHGEILQVSEYLPGQKYTLHPDSIDSGPGPHSMQRIVTFLMYLNDVEEGGSTIFPRGNGLNQHISRHDTEPWNLQHYCNQNETLKIKPKRGRAIFWYNHHTDLSWDPNTIHGACHVKKGIKYVAQRWIRWHTTQTLGFNPLQNSLNRASHLHRQLDEQKRLNQATSKDQTKVLLNKVTQYEQEMKALTQKITENNQMIQDYKNRIVDLGDSIPLHIDYKMASIWRSWMTSKIMFVPIMNNIVDASILNVLCLFHGNGCNDNVRSIYSSQSVPIRATELSSAWSDGFQQCFRWTITRSPYARLVEFYDRLAVRNQKDANTKLDTTWKKRLNTLGSFFEFIVGPVRMYHFSMTPTAGGDIGRHPGTRSQEWHLTNSQSQLLVDYVARYDHLKVDLLKICQKVKQKDASIPCSADALLAKTVQPLKGENHEHIMKYFSSDRVNLFQIVNDAFANDFLKFNYPKVNSIEEYQKQYIDQ